MLKFALIWRSSAPFRKEGYGRHVDHKTACHLKHVGPAERERVEEAFAVLAIEIEGDVVDGREARIKENPGNYVKVFIHSPFAKAFFLPEAAAEKLAAGGAIDGPLVQGFPGDFRSGIALAAHLLDVAVEAQPHGYGGIAVEAVGKFLYFAGHYLCLVAHDFVHHQLQEQGMQDVVGIKKGDIFPRALSSPVLRAAERPWFLVCTTFILEVLLVAMSQIWPEASREPSSMRISSQSE